MRQSGGIEGIRDLLVDTNLLLVFVVGAVAREHLEAFKHTNAYTPADYDLLTALLGRARRVLVTPHVMTEVSNLAGRLQSNYRRAAFALLAQLATTLEERSLATVDVVAEPLFLRLGLTDAAISRVAAGEVTVLTDDLDLYLALEHAGARVLNFNHVRRGSWGQV